MQTKISGNYLDQLTDEAWTAFSKGLKTSGITSLDVTENNLEALSSEQSIAFCDGLSLAIITKLEILSFNGFHNYQIQQLQKIIDNNIRRLGLGENGIQNLCAFSFWKMPGAKIEKVKILDNENKETYYQCTSDQITEPKNIPKNDAK